MPSQTSPAVRDRSTLVHLWLETVFLSAPLPSPCRQVKEYSSAAMEAGIPSQASPPYSDNTRVCHGPGLSAAYGCCLVQQIVQTQKEFSQKLNAYIALHRKSLQELNTKMDIASVGSRGKVSFTKGQKEPGVSSVTFPFLAPISPHPLVSPHSLLMDTRGDNADMDSVQLIELGRRNIKETDESLNRTKKVVQDTLEIGAQVPCPDLG